MGDPILGCPVAPYSLSLASAPLPPAYHMVLAELPVTGPTCPPARYSKSYQSSQRTDSLGTGPAMEQDKGRWLKAPLLPLGYEPQGHATVPTSPEGHSHHAEGAAHRGPCWQCDYPRERGFLSKALRFMSYGMAEPFKCQLS